MARKAMNSYQLSPLLTVIDGFLTPQECNHLIELARPRLTKAEVSGAGGAESSPVRNNRMCWIEHDASSAIQVLIHRLAMLARLPMHHAEALQVVRYDNGEYYKAHFDAYDVATTDGQRYVRESGNRLISVIGYLNTVNDGGATSFPKLKLTIGAVAGRVALFDNCLPGTNQVNPDSLHEALPSAGEKWAFNLWFRERPYQLVKGQVAKSQSVQIPPVVIGDIKSAASNGFMVPKRFAAGSRLVCADPHIEVIDDLISAQECDQIIAAANRHMKRALVSEGKGEGAVSDTRTGRVHWLPHSENAVIDAVTQRIAKRVGIPRKRAEPLQIIHYGVTQEYRAHFDGYDMETETGRRFTENGGQRVLTVLCYLNDVDEGGGTSFPELGIEVAAKRGSAVIFQNCATGTNSIHPMSLHAGMPVTKGEKWACNLWFREKEYRWR